ncbi:hypothetical protein [Microbacterium album]|uniref:hypothetical protein n=1 Tax=Microbacterium album TaxID=2053191 RepID=UPI00166E7BFB|nr:hypothetical protein [Microbacterium album]
MELENPPVLEAFAYEDLLAQASECSTRDICDLAPYEELQAEWQRVTEDWPLPIPEVYPFPDRLKEITGGTLYTVGYGLGEADRWWTCAAETAALTAQRDGDAVMAAYWLQALRLWWEGDAKAYLFVNPENYVADVLEPALDGQWHKLQAQSNCDAVLVGAGTS